MLKVKSVIKNLRIILSVICRLAVGNRKIDFRSNERRFLVRQIALAVGVNWIKNGVFNQINMVSFEVHIEQTFGKKSEYAPLVSIPIGIRIDSLFKMTFNFKEPLAITIK